MSFGVYIPRLRIKREEYQAVWGYFSPRSVEEKSVAGFDEDPVTMSVEAASNAFRNGQVDASEIDAVYFASTRPPYEEKQNASTIATALGCKAGTATLDVTTSVSAGSSTLLSCLDFVGSGRGEVGLVVAADSPLADPTDPLEHQLGAGAAAMIVGIERLGAVVDGSFSFVGEALGERFRRNGRSFVTTVDLGRYHEAVSEETVTSCVKGLMEKMSRSARDYDSFVLQGLDEGKALALSKKLGFDEAETTQGMISRKIGDAGAATPLLALCKVLESASPKQLVILCSYGPGGGTNALSLVVEKEMKPATRAGYEDYLAAKEYIDYATYLRVRRFLGKS